MRQEASLERVYDLADQAAKLEIESENYQLETKKSIWLKMGDELESNNFPKTDIYSEIHGLIQERMQELRKDNTVIFNNGYLHRICDKQGWTKSSLGNVQDTSRSVPDLIGENVKERTEFIQFMNDIKDEADANIKTLKQSEYEDEHGNKIKVTWSNMFNDDSFSLLGNLFYSDREEWRRQRDSRQSLLPKMRMLITALSSVMTNKYFCSTYFAKVKSIQNITSKKMLQYMRDARSMSDLFQNCQDDSYLWNFMPLPCPDCGQESLKTRMYENGYWDFICYNWDYHKTGEKHFKPEIFMARIKQLSINSGGSAIRYVTKHGLDVPDN